MMLQALSVLGPVLVATESRNGRALSAAELAALASANFERVEAELDPVSRARVPSSSRAPAAPCSSRALCTFWPT